MDFVKFLVSLLFIFTINAKTALLELTAKQSIQNIKYITKENDITFYVKSNKILAFSSNFKAYEIIKNSDESEFGIQKHPTKDLYLITSRPSVFENLNSYRDLQIYLYSTSDRKLTVIGNGALANFNHDGSLITYYSFQNSTFYLLKSSNIFEPYKIKLNTKNPYFRPQLAAIDLQNIYYTDLNNDNQIGLLKVDTSNQARSTILKAESLNTKFELAHNATTLYILETLFKKQGFTNIYSLQKGEADISKRNFLFEAIDGSSTQLMLINNKLSFIKSFGPSAKYSEVYSHDLSTKKTFIISDLDFVTTYFRYESNLYIPFREDIFVLNNEAGEYLINKEFKIDHQADTKPTDNPAQEEKK